MAQRRMPVTWRGSIWGSTGYAGSNRAAVLALAAAGEVDRVMALDRPTAAVPPAQAEVLRRLCAAKAADSACIINGTPPFRFDLREPARRRIGYFTFESLGLPPGWAGTCKFMNCIWVPSRFNLEQFAAAGISAGKLHLAPYGVDTRLFAPGAPPLPVAGRRAFNFLSVFEWQWRKGWDILLRAFLSEFRGDEDVSLTLKVSHDFHRVDPRPELQRLIQAHGRSKPDGHAPVLLLDRRLSDAEMPALFAAADAFVLPSRGEGWGRPYAEAMACGLPTIGPNWGGPLTFMTSANAYLIDIEDTRRVQRGQDLPLYTGLTLAEPNVESLRHLLREVVAHPEAAQARGAQARADMVRDWDLPQVVQQYLIPALRAAG